MVLKAVLGVAMIAITIVAVVSEYYFSLVLKLHFALGCQSRGGGGEIRITKGGCMWP